VAGKKKSEITGTDQGITCIDDAPQVAGLAARQELLTKWYRILALGPFGVIIFVAYKFANDWLQVSLVFAALIWALAVTGYAFYLFLAVRCPACKSRFGVGGKCRSCGLPRHRDSSRIAGDMPPRS
jgi:hypothetical protein